MKLTELDAKLKKSAFISIDGMMYRMLFAMTEDNQYCYVDEDTCEESIVSLDELIEENLKFYEITELNN